MTNDASSSHSLPARQLVDQWLSKWRAELKRIGAINTAENRPRQFPELSVFIMLNELAALLDPAPPGVTELEIDKADLAPYLENPMLVLSDPPRLDPAPPETNEEEDDHARGGTKGNPQAVLPHRSEGQSGR